MTRAADPGAAEGDSPRFHQGGNVVRFQREDAGRRASDPLAFGERADSPPRSPAAFAQLANCRLLRQLSPHEAEWLAGRVVTVVRRKGEFVLQSFDRSGDIYILLEGLLIANRYSVEGREVGFGQIRPGGYVGQVAAIDGLPRSSNIVALTDVRLGRIPAACVRHMLDTSPAFTRALLEDLGDTVRQLRRRLFERSAMTVAMRIRLELARMAAASGIDGNRSVIVHSPTHAQLASLLGGQREAVTREFRRLHVQGILARRGRDLHILDVEALVRRGERFGREGGAGDL